MKPLFCAVLAVLGFTGCGKISKAEAELSGYSIVCVEKVRYIQFSSGATVQVGTDGKVKTCE